MKNSSTVAAASGVLPPNSYGQHEITEALAAMYPPGQRGVIERFHAACGVQTRHLVLPLDEYPRLDGFTRANDVFIQAALDLGGQAVSKALAQVGLAPADVDVIMTVSVTGLATPSIDARLVNRLGLRPDVKRLPVFGLGCVAGAAGIARLDDYLRAWPDQVAVLLAVETCSLTLQRDDPSVANVVASGLFGDGAAAVVVVGAERARRLDCAGPGVVATRSRMYPDTEEAMGWQIGANGFRVVLSADVPDLVERYLRADVEEFLAVRGLAVTDVGSWVCHPGGPKVLDAVRTALDLPTDALELTWRSLARIGNLSSASVLHVLADTIAQRPGEPGAPGMLLAMGPGFCCELVLLEW